MLYYSRGSETDHLSGADLKQGLFEALDKLGARRKVLALPPDITRFYSRAGDLTRYAWQYYHAAMTDVLPALGTHFPMTEGEIRRMFGDVHLDLFRQHDWREGLATLGDITTTDRKNPGMKSFSTANSMVGVLVSRDCTQRFNTP